MIRSLVCVEKIIGAGGKAHTGWASFPEPVEHPTSLGGESGTVSFYRPRWQLLQPQTPAVLRVCGSVLGGCGKGRCKGKEPQDTDSEEVAGRGTECSPGIWGGGKKNVKKEM